MDTLQIAADISTSKHPTAKARASLDLSRQEVGQGMVPRMGLDQLHRPLDICRGSDLPRNKDTNFENHAGDKVRGSELQPDDRTLCLANMGKTPFHRCYAMSGVASAGFRSGVYRALEE